MAQMRSDRGQLLLVGGLTLALLLVVLAILLNGVIYAENTATRSGDASQEALEYNDAVVGTVGGLLDAENEQHDTHMEINQALEEGESEIDRQLHQQFIRRGAATSFERTDREDGHLIVQNDSGEFVDDDGEDYIEVDDVDRTRAFRIDLDSLEDPPTNDPVNESFRIALSNATDEHRYYLYEDGSTVVLAVGEDEEDPEEICEIDADTSDVRVDLTGGYLTDGEERVGCHGAEWPGVEDSYDIEFVNGDAVRGTFSMTVLTTTVEFDESTGPATVTDAIYSVDVTIRYDSQSTEYESTARIAPGEPP